MPKISVITPIYIDVPDKMVWFDEMLQSLLAQTEQDWEVILIDDKSPFDLGEPKWKYQDEERFRWFKTAENVGPATVRNTAAALAESEALLPLDADDKLASEHTLQQMYDEWVKDKTKIIYGNLQLLEIENNQFQLQKIYELGAYTFENVMNLGGTIPVTGMHSYKCHLSAGGWKAELYAGREDVEYWVAAGKAGCCGQKIDYTTLFYRRHDESRDYGLKHISKKENEMRQIILAMHKDIYEGRFPVGCCGGRGGAVNSTETASKSQVQQQGRITPLSGFSEDQLIWVQYQGPKKAAFNMVGVSYSTEYRILGPGHKLQVHQGDIANFKSLDRGQAFLVGIPDPTQRTVEPIPEVQATDHVFQPPPLDLAVIESVDQIALDNQELVVQPLATSVPSLETVLTEAKIYNLVDLDIGNLEILLSDDKWTIETIASAKIRELTKYKGIGTVRSAKIIEKAQELIEGN